MPSQIFDLEDKNGDCQPYQLAEVVHLPYHSVAFTHMAARYAALQATNSLGKANYCRCIAGEMKMWSCITAQIAGTKSLTRNPLST